MNKDNWFAFPVNQYVNTSEFEYQGELACLRDWLAISATEEDIQYQIRKIAPRNGFGEVMNTLVDRSKARYAHADAMLEARK